MAKRRHPNSYFTWYNDDKRLAILCTDTTTVTGERTVEKYDTFQGNGNLSGSITDADCSGTTITFTSAAHGLVTGDRVSISGTTNFNDDNLASQSITRTGANTFTMTRASSSSATNVTGNFISLFVDNGLRITFHSKYETVTTSNLTSELSSAHGLDTGMQNALLCYMKARMFEDSGDIERAMYFRRMYERAIKQYPSRKSGVRTLAVPRI